MDNEKLFGFMEKMYGEMQNGFNNVNKRFDKVEDRLDKVEKRLDKVEQKLDNLEKGQLVLENNLDDTRKTLFDGYVQNSEAIERLETKVDDMQADVNLLGAKTFKNENKILEFGKHLKSVEKRNI